LFLPTFQVILILGFVLPLAFVLTKASGWGEILTPDQIDFSRSAFSDAVVVRHGSLGDMPLARIIIRGFNFGVIGNSIFIAVVVTLATMLVGTVMALLTGFYLFPGRRLFKMLAFIPLLITPFVNAYVVTRIVMPKAVDYNVL